MCVGPCLRETSSLISIQNCFWLTLADEELTGFFIFAAFYWHLMGSSFRLDALILGWSIKKREVSQLIISKLNYISFSVDPFFILVANNVDPDEMRHFV